MRGSGSAEELSLDKGLLSNDEGRGRSTLGISGSLVTTLGFSNSDSEFLVKFI